MHFRVGRGPYRRATALCLNHEVVLHLHPLNLSHPPPPPRHLRRSPGLPSLTLLHHSLPKKRLGQRPRQPHPTPHGHHRIPMIIMFRHPEHTTTCLSHKAKCPQTGPGSVHWPHSACPELLDRRQPRSRKLQRGKQQMRGDTIWMRRRRDEPLR
jgi:hypothetical protein